MTKKELKEHVMFLLELNPHQTFGVMHNPFERGRFLYPVRSDGWEPICYVLDTYPSTSLSDVIDEFAKKDVDMARELAAIMERNGLPIKVYDK